MKVIKRVPIPICGVALALLTLGNLLQSYGEWLRQICGSLAVIFLILLLIKGVNYTDIIKQDLKNPIQASVISTLPMALMILSGYLKSVMVWRIALCIHIAWMLYFTINFMVKPKLQQIFASYFIVYVGIGAAVVTAPQFGQYKIGELIVWFGIISFIILLTIITARYIKIKEIPEPAKPLICIYAAPVSLCLVGYLQCAESKSESVVVGLFLVSVVFYIFALWKAICYLRLPFFPSYAAFTFPFAISAVAVKQTKGYFMNIGKPISGIGLLEKVEMFVAIILIAYVSVRFVMFLLKAERENC